MIHPEFWVWFAWVMVGIIVLFFVPGEARYPLMAVIVLGGLAYLYKQGGSLEAIAAQFKGK